MKAWIAFWNILLKDMKNYYLKPPNISWGIIFPFAWTLMFFLKSNSAPNIREILRRVDRAFTGSTPHRTVLAQLTHTALHYNIYY